MKWLGVHLGRRGARLPADAPSVSELPVGSQPGDRLSDRPSDRDVRIVRDVATHVTSKIVPIVELHGRTMENALQANVMAIEVALRIGLEATLRTALTSLTQGGSLEDAVARIDDALAILTQGLGDHRPELVATIEAAHAGIIGGQVR